MVLELHERHEGATTLVAVPRAELRQRLPLPGLRAEVQGRAVRPRPVGGRLPSRSGAKYVVLTSKHHEGFALWPSAQASRTWGRPWNSVETGPQRDLLGDLAARGPGAGGLKMGFYYSLYEWFNPLWLSDFASDTWTSTIIPQFKDVVTRYKPSIIFADGEWEHAQRRLAERRSCWPGSSTSRRAGTTWSWTTAGARKRAASTAATTPPSTAAGPTSRDAGPRLGGEPRHGLLLRLQPQRGRSTTTRLRAS